MKRILTVVGLCILFLILDNTIVPFFAIYGFYPSLLFTFAICYSIINGPYEGIWIGIFAGFLQDLYFFNGTGINAFADMICCVIAAQIGSMIFREKRLIPLAASFALAFLKGALVFAILFVAKQYTSFRPIIYNSLYTMAITLFFYKRVYNLCQKEYMQKRWSFNKK